MKTGDKSFYVYELRDCEGVTFYVGKGSKNRIKAHRSPSNVVRAKTHLYRKIRKIWNQGLDFIAEKVFETDIESEAFREERRLIAFYGKSNLCNKTDGGEGTSGYFHTAETREAISQRMKNSPPERLAAFRAAAPKKGHRVSSETHAKMCQANRRHIPERTHKNKQAARKRVENNTPHWQKFREAGFNPTMETRKKMGRKGRVLSDDTRQKMSETRKGSVLKEETRKKISKALRGKSKIWRRYSDLNDRSFTAYELAELANTTPRVIYGRISQGWTVDRILTCPVYSRPNRSINMRTKNAAKRVIALADDKRPAVSSAIAAMPNVEDDEPAFE